MHRKWGRAEQLYVRAPVLRQPTPIPRPHLQYTRTTYHIVVRMVSASFPPGRRSTRAPLLRKQFDSSPPPPPSPLRRSLARLSQLLIVSCNYCRFGPVRLAGWLAHSLAPPPRLPPSDRDHPSVCLLSGVHSARDARSSARCLNGWAVSRRQFVRSSAGSLGHLITHSHALGRLAGRPCAQPRCCPFINCMRESKQGYISGASPKRRIRRTRRF